jgi:D-galactose 1-dehydrogenase
MDLDWRQTGPQTWDIEVETDAGQLKLSQGGAVLDLPGETRRDRDREYPGLYARFVDLVRAGESDVDVTPLQLVADAFLSGRRVTVEAFED